MSSERIQVLDFPKAAPGKCVICGFAGGVGTDGRKFIDFQFDLDFFGAIIFCEHCFTAGVNALGYLSPQQTTDLKFNLQDLGEKLQRVLAENDKLRSALDSLSFLPSSSDSNSSSTDEKLPEPAETKGSSDNGSPKPSNKRGSKNVLDNDEIDESILGI